MPGLYWPKALQWATTKRLRDLCFRYNDNPEFQSDDVIIKVIPKSELLANQILEEPLYNVNLFPWKASGTLLLLILVSGTFLLIRQFKTKTNTVLVLEDTPIYKGQKFPMDEISIALLKLLITSGGEVSSRKVFELVENPNLSEGHNLKLRAQLVDGINLKLKALLQTEKDMIKIARSATDRRNKSYRLDVSRFVVRH